MIAVAEDDLETFKTLQALTEPQFLVSLRFKNGMNILNLALDQEAKLVVKHIFDFL